MAGLPLLSAAFCCCSILTVFALLISISASPGAPGWEGHPPAISLCKGYFVTSLQTFKKQQQQLNNNITEMNVSFLNALNCSSPHDSLSEAISSHSLQKQMCILMSFGCFKCIPQRRMSVHVIGASKLHKTLMLSELLPCFFCWC